MIDFFEKVYVIVRQIPKGRVASYGQIASLISTPRAARMVGTALRSLSDTADIPWHRVINSKGIITIDNINYPREEQANRLMAEGVVVTVVNGDYVIDVSQYLWVPEQIDKSTEP